MKTKPLKLGLPYKGSKRKLAHKIVDKILQDNPNTKYVYDLFGGGGAVTFEFASRPQIEVVNYNEINKAVTTFLKDVLENGVIDKYYQWVDRETFMKHRFDNDWFGGFVSVIYSFGNDLRSYIYGKHIEKLKYKAHKAIVDCDKQMMKELGVNLDCSKTIQERRLDLQRQIKELTKNRKGELQHLERLSLLEHITRVQNLQNINHLEKLKTSFIDKIKITSKSYDDVILNTPVNETIIYLDPPYRNTNKYQDVIDYEKFYDWVRKCPYTVYVSEYNMPDDFEVVMEFNHRAINGASINNKVTEKLFIYKKKKTV